jgi:hypothetical protein
MIIVAASVLHKSPWNRKPDDGGAIKQTKQLLNGKNVEVWEGRIFGTDRNLLANLAAEQLRSVRTLHILTIRDVTPCKFISRII